MKARSCTPSFVMGLGLGALRPGTTALTSSRRPPAMNVAAARASMSATAPGFEPSGNIDTLDSDVDAAQAAYSPGPLGETAKAGIVRKQMEFWFSPSNMRRDWYLRRQMDDEGWLDPAIFLRFNRLKQLNASLPEVIDACKGSSLLEVSAPDETASFGDDVGQTRVRRSIDLPSFSAEAIAETECSLVVENLPEGATIDTIRDIFLRFGEVTYTWVSKPTSKDPSQYAIVSFPSIKAAGIALESYNNAPLPADVVGSMTVKTKALWDALISRQRNSSIVVRVSGLSADITWRDLWNELTILMRSHDITIVYFLYKNGDPSCYITLSDQDTADVVVNTVFSKTLMLCGCLVEPHLLTDEGEQQKYWENASVQMLERKKKKERSVRSNSPNSTTSPGSTSTGPGGKYSSTTTSSSDPNSPPQGVIVRMEELPLTVGWRRLMAELKSLGNVVFLNYQNESDVCYVRFGDAATASEVVAQLTSDNPVKLFDCTVTASILTGKDEEAYWQRAAAERLRKRTQQSEGANRV
jgi:La domain/RNA binding motif/RNA recognition motif. (a.k.a. RRM, RBD, or RNP domain)